MKKIILFAFVAIAILSAWYVYEYYGFANGVKEDAVKRNQHINNLQKHDTAYFILKDTLVK